MVPKSAAAVNGVKEVLRKSALFLKRADNGQAWVPETVCPVQVLMPPNSSTLV